MRTFKKVFFLILSISFFSLTSCKDKTSIKGIWIVQNIELKTDSESGMASVIWANILSQNTRVEFKDNIMILDDSMKITYQINDGTIMFEGEDPLAYSINGSKLKLAKKDVEMILKRE